MNKLLSIFTILFLLTLTSHSIAGDDGKLEINKNNNGYEEVNDCFENY